MKRTWIKWIPYLILAVALSYTATGLCGKVFASQTCPMRCCSEENCGMAKSCCSPQSEVALSLTKSIDIQKNILAFNEALVRQSPQIHSTPRLLFVDIPLALFSPPLFILNQSFLC